MTTKALVLAGALGTGATLAMPATQEGLDRLSSGHPVSVGPDRVAAGMEVTLRDSVPADAMATGGQVSVDAPVGGDVLGAGGVVEVSGPVGGAVRAAGGQVELRSPVARNVTLAGREVRMRARAEVGGNAYLAGGSVDVDRPVRGHLLVGGGEVRVDAPVEGNVEVAADRLVLGPGARIQGDLRYRSPNPVDRAPEAVVGGIVTRAPLDGRAAPRWLPSVPDWAGALFGLATFLFSGLVLAALFPGGARRVLDAGREKPLPSLGVGVLTLLAVPVLILVVMISVVGLPLGLVGAALFAFALYLARAVLALWIGDAILGDGAGEGRRRVVLTYLLGGTLVFLAGLVPWAGAAVKVLATAFGLGAAALAVREARRGGSGAPAGTPTGGTSVG